MSSRNVQSDEIMLTVKMLAYNHEKYIAQAIESILSQKTEYSYELLIGEDCSTDRTREIIEMYAKKYPDIIHTIFHEKNVGCTKNSYTLDIHARGKYIAGCEGDDYWCDETRIQRDIDFLEEHSEYSGICHRCKIVDEDGNELLDKQFSDRVAFWRFEKDIYTLHDFEQWKLPGHGSARTGRNLIKGNEEESTIIYKASGRVGDRTHVLLQVLGGDIYCMNDEVSCYRYRIQNGEGNFSSLQHKKNLRAEDFLMLQKLESWARDIKGITLDLGKVKKDRLCGSAIVLMRHPSKENINVLCKIVKYSGEPLKYIYYIIKAICLKAYYVYVKKEDKQIEL